MRTAGSAVVGGVDLRAAAGADMVRPGRQLRRRGLAAHADVAAGDAYFPQFRVDVVVVVARRGRQAKYLSSLVYEVKVGGAAIPANRVSRPEEPVALGTAAQFPLVVFRSFLRTGVIHPALISRVDQHLHESCSAIPNDSTYALVGKKHSLPLI